MPDCPGIVHRERQAVRLVARRRLGRIAARDPRRRRVRLTRHTQPPARNSPPPTHIRPPAPPGPAHPSPAPLRPELPARPTPPTRPAAAPRAPSPSESATHPGLVSLLAALWTSVPVRHTDLHPALPLLCARPTQSVFAAARVLLARRHGARLPELPYPRHQRRRSTVSRPSTPPLTPLHARRPLGRS